MKLLRRILRLKDPLDDGQNVSLRPSLIERLDDIFAHDRTRLNEVLPEDIETTSSSEHGPIQAPVHAELDSLTEDSLSTELSPGTQAETGEPFQTVTADAKESLGMPAEAMAANSIALAAKEAAAQLQAAHQEMEASLKNHSEDHRKRLAELSSHIQGLADELENAAKDLLNRSAKQLQQQADATAAALDEELKASRQGFIDETKKQLTSMTQASLESLTKATTEQTRNQLSQMLNEFLAKGLRELEAKDRELLKKQVEAIHKQIDAAKEAAAQLQTAHQEMEASLKNHSEDHRKRLAELSSHTQGLADELENAAKDLLNRSAKQLQQQADATVAALGEELKASRQGFIDETKKQLASMTQASLESLTKATTEHARNHLSQIFNEFVAKGLRELEAQHRALLKQQHEAIHKQIDDFSRARLEPRGESTPLEHTPKRRVGGLRTGLKLGLGVSAIALILVGIYASALPVSRLRAEPPAGFFEERPDSSAKRRAREEQLARAYWECAMQDMQAKYKFGANLPDEPPAEFRVEEKDLSGRSPKVDPVARARYWGKLRQVWVLPEAWEKSSAGNMDWIRSALQSAYSKAKELVPG